MQLARDIAVTAILLGALTACGLKGKRGFVLLGFLLPIFWIIGAIKAAKPTSWWARRTYGDVAMSESEQHFVFSKRERTPLDPN